MALESGTKGFQKGFHRLRRTFIVRASLGLAGVNACFAVNPVQGLGLLVVRLQFGVIQGPRRRYSVLERHLAEILFAHAFQHRPPDLGVSSPCIGGLRCKGIAVGSEPALTLGVISILAEQIHVGDVLVFEGHRPAALQHEHVLAASAQGSGQGASSGTAADNDDVVVAVVDDHGITARRRSEGREESRSRRRSAKTGSPQRRPSRLCRSSLGRKNAPTSVPSAGCR